MRSRVQLLPEIRDPAAFPALFARVAFHLAHADPEAITFLVAPDVLADVQALVESPTVPDGFGAEVLDAIERIASVVMLRDASTADPAAVDAHADVVAVWDGDAFASSRWAPAMAQRTPRITIFDVDLHRTKLEASHFALLAERITAPSSAAEAQHFRARTASLRQGADVYLLGTGPSIREAFDHDLSRGVRIVCNTVILDDDLMAHVRPQVVTCADPIFHFGPSTYASRYRTVLRRRLASDPDLTAIVPLRYRGLLVDLMPEHADQIVGVPLLGSDTPLVLDLDGIYGVKPFANVLTLLMLPVAATIGTHIGLIGFDGRRSDDTYYWSYGPTVQLRDELEAIRRVHPGFFQVDFEDYYDDHVATVEQVFEACEARGIEIVGMSTSHMPPVVRRSALLRLPAIDWDVPDAASSTTLVVSVDPDWVDDFGHHGPWFRALRNELDVLGVPSVSLASRANTSGDGALPTFTYPTTNPRATPLYHGVFEVELAAAVERLRAGDPSLDVVLAFYTGDIHHLPAIIRVARDGGERVRAVVNLMRAHRALLDAVGRPSARTSTWTYALRELVRCGADHGVVVTCDTEEQAEITADVVEATLPVWPMASASAVTTTPAARSDGPLLLYCPAQSQVAKGVVQFVDAAERIIRDGASVPVSFAMRDVTQPARTDPRVEAALERAAEAGIDVRRGALDDVGYAAAIENADIVVVPYHVDPFRTRTSSVVVEAGIAGKPVIVASGTWGAAVAHRFGIGVEFRSGDADDLARAMTEAVARFKGLAERAALAAPAIAEEYSMARVATFVVDVRPGDVGLPDGPADRLLELEHLLHAYLEGAGEGRHETRLRVRDLQKQWISASLPRGSRHATQ